MRMFVAAALLLGGCATPAPVAPASVTMPPPVAPKHPHSVTVHGDTRVDEYDWMRDKDSAEVRAYLEAENAYASDFMAPTLDLQKTLYDEIVGRIQETDQSAPYRSGAFEYYHRTEEGKQYRVYCRREPGKPDTETVLLDMNALAEGRAFLGLGAFEVSPNGQYLAFSLDETGFREYTLQIKDMRTGQVLPERIEKVKSVAWASDSETFFYTLDDETKRPHQVLRHRLGAVEEDPVLHQEDDERFRVAVWRARSGGFVYRGLVQSYDDGDRVRRSGLPVGRLPRACTPAARHRVRRRASGRGVLDSHERPRTKLSGRPDLGEEPRSGLLARGRTSSRGRDARGARPLPALLRLARTRGGPSARAPQLFQR